MSTDPETAESVFTNWPPEGTRWGDYLRRITFLDTTPLREAADAPLHVGQALLLNGVKHNELIPAGQRWTVSGASDAASVVTFVAFAEHVDLGQVVTDPPPPDADHDHPIIRGRAICGMPVLTPVDEQYAWEVIPGDDDGARDMVRVSVFVREVEIIAAKRPAEVPS